MLRQLRTPAIQKPNSTTGRIQLSKKIADRLGDDSKLKSAIAALALKKYKQPAKPLQIEAVAHLARGSNTFLLAGTGFGKSRIPEIYYSLLPKTSKGVVLVLNPLDALGDNQVLEKENTKFSAINLTKLTFTKEEANNIVNGKYNFVYVSPEIYLNSKLWDQVYFCTNFQNRLALIVVDEAHIIYQWGLVESVGGKNKLATLGYVDDMGIFRPSYGKLGARLLTCNDKPILLMSATCRPEAVAGIKKSLKLEDHNLEMVKGELTRPEIRIIRVPMKHSMASCADILEMFTSKNLVPNSNVVPTLIYSATRNRTLQVMKALDLARGTRGDSIRPKSTFVRRFHSCTGEKDKLAVVKDFADHKFPVISCTMALGMGQNWSQTRRGGKNSVNDFVPGARQTHQDRMDALAVTPVCLRIAFAIDNEIGYIPLSFDDPSYIREKEREKKVGFVDCMCSNCNPIAADGLMRHIKEMDKDNMDEMIVREDWPAAEPLITTTKRKRAMEGGTTTTKRIRLSKTLEEMLSANLIDGFQKAFDIKYPHGTMLYPDNLFGQPQIDNIINNFGTFDGKAGLSKIIGGRFIPGQIDILNTVINDFTTGPLANEEALKINTKAASREDAKAQKLSEKQAQREQKSREKDQERAAIQEAKRVEAEKGEARTCIETCGGGC
ncbi:hypothetical protein MJO29_009046 [Puccinia striiformis f. sp. tritici]|nr:hypothetical protein MJO29_009046 [Puccinia striiformis f. sp. tritici]